ncbi:MAG: RHS repeat-associated core domain-containing protein [Desulfobacterales bacterium]|nr:RHS repeat-associated core domain-containing protein [Desulfobacterales bacterium]
MLFWFGLTVGTELKTTYQYEPERNLRTQIKNEFGSQTVSQYDYEYNEQGSRTSLVTDGSAFGGVIPGPDNQVADYMTNSLNRYTDITTTVNSDQQVTNVPVYDDDGNLTKISDYPGSLKYSYNAENRLVAAAPELPMQGDIKVEFVYDYVGRRVKKTVSVWNGTWVQEIEKLFVYDGWNMICEITSENSQPATEKYYVWGLDLSRSLQGAGGIGGLIATLDKQAGVVYYYLYDANGNVGQLANAADGSIAAHYEYDPFGNTIKAEGEYKDSNPYRFSTKYFDSETGLYYYGFRFYNPTLGRWLNRDPIEEDGGLNLYVFTKNEPINQIDLLGQFSEFIDCCPCQENALRNDEQAALQYMSTLMRQIETELAARPQARISEKEPGVKGNRDPSAGQYRDIIANQLEKALKVLRLSHAKLPTCKVKCVEKDGAPYASVWPFGNTIKVYEGRNSRLYWHLTDIAQAAGLVHEATHAAAATTDAQYYWQTGNGIKSGLIAYPYVASTYDTWILTGFCVPGINCATTVTATVARGSKECP